MNEHIIFQCSKGKVGVSLSTYHVCEGGEVGDRRAGVLPGKEGGTAGRPIPEENITAW